MGSKEEGQSSQLMVGITGMNNLYAEDRCRGRVVNVKISFPEDQGSATTLYEL